LTDNGGGSITIGYTGAAADISGVSMLVTINNGDGNLANPNADATGEGDFNTHIDYWHSAGGTPVLGVGAPVGDALVAGMPVAGAQVFAISTGVLKDPPGGAAAAGSDIATIQLSGTGCSDVTLSLDTAGRGDVVDVNGDAEPLTFPATTQICLTAECYVGTEPDYAEWVSVGSPDCWCYPTQCHGDADGLEVAATKTVPAHYVGTPDLTALSTAWKVATESMTLDMMCADFDHAEVAATKTVPAHRVGTPDLTILATYWKDAATPVNCLPGTITP
jgi:hypothetical protein